MFFFSAFNRMKINVAGFLTLAGKTRSGKYWPVLTSQKSNNWKCRIYWLSRIFYKVGMLDACGNMLNFYKAVHVVRHNVRREISWL
jgi:hypothetical protein